ncbi:NAD kinase [uncultured Nocardioides sp.]|uniref:NAD kinase n=1 Tax=uncultured Nocardioides sp. TaxID=198441 RepID=UPI002627BE89|nr:NAD kinase [uncultured Nocardioides sp.]
MTDHLAAEPTAGRRVLLLAHTGRAESCAVAKACAEALAGRGVAVRLLPGEAADLIGDGPVPAGHEVWSPEDAGPGGPGAGCELAVVIGGDGTILRAAEVTRDSGIPLLGVNLGHVGFLAEAEQDDLAVTIDAVVDRSYDIEDRLTLEVLVLLDGEVLTRTFAVNEASVEKAERQRMVEVLVEVDGRPLSRWGCDGVVLATPTGSTAYNFSAGGPVVWPQVEAMLMVPISAHALFARPLVVDPRSVMSVEVQDRPDGAGVLWCDGRRTVDLVPGARVEVRRGERPLRLVRLHQAPFSDRLVAKFRLPVAGWRGAPGPGEG